jgi:pSer/pThr/pTyr-binding forkhead associated (FHA) protein
MAPAGARAVPSLKPRPPAPAVSFAPRVEPSPPAPVVAAPAPPAPVAPAAGGCPQCGTVNQPGMRFCVTCGALLIAPPAPRGARPAGPVVDLSRTVPDPPSFSVELLAAAAQPPPPVAPAAPAIAPVRVMDLGSPPEQPSQRLCPRCRGACEAPSQFCRFCGASLADAQVFPVQPAPNPIAQAAPPPVAVPPPRSLTPVARIVAVVPAPVPPPIAAPAPVPAPIPITSPPIVAPAVAAPSASPAPHATRARLVLIARDGGEGPSFPLGESTDIGRTEGNVVIAEDRYISPRHARITVRQGVFYLRDLDSTNGMYVRIPFPRLGLEPTPTAPPDVPPGGDNQASAEQILTDQDLFLVGQQVLRFEVVKNAEEGFGVASENGTLLFGTPAAPRYARLSQRTVEGVVRDVFHVRKAETVIGREQGDIVFNDDPFLSRRHCVLRVNGGGPGQGPRSFALADLGSSNGTFLQVREEVRLRHGDHFRIGQQLFRFDT